jgi:hypothetical protein
VPNAATLAAQRGAKSLYEKAQHFPKSPNQKITKEKIPVIGLILKIRVPASPRSGEQEPPIHNEPAIPSPFRPRHRASTQIKAEPTIWYAPDFS